MKYLILDKEKWDSWVQAAKDDTARKMVETVLGSMTIDGTVLSEEESLEKFKEVWDNGYDEGNDYKLHTEESRQEDWEKFSKTL